jgi:hypothetical protein
MQHQLQRLNLHHHEFHLPNHVLVATIAHQAFHNV